MTPLAKTELDRGSSRLKSGGREGNVRIVGHTCDVGSDKVNDRLCLKRADAVQDYLVSSQAFRRDEVHIEGKGKARAHIPSYTVHGEKNRRVELEFFRLIDIEETVEIAAQLIPGTPASGKLVPAKEPEITFDREFVDQPPLGRNVRCELPAVHKRTVDVYRSKRRGHCRQPKWRIQQPRSFGPR
ncbi:MAG: OmpA family protein [Betaproteobacteria bacterium]|nr:OmpA family protein [Betaproteobacteria bacterium]